MPSKGSSPAIGEPNEQEKVLEYKIELVCDEEYIRSVIAALKKAHPYEMPGYQVTLCEEF
jgi:structural hemagglutinin/hemolysin toxin protein RtxA